MNGHDRVIRSDERFVISHKLRQESRRCKNVNAAALLQEVAAWLAGETVFDEKLKLWEHADRLCGEPQEVHELRTVPDALPWGVELVGVSEMAGAADSSEGLEPVSSAYRAYTLKATRVTEASDERG